MVPIATLEQLTAGAGIRGVIADAAVIVVKIVWHGSDVVTLSYRSADGAVAERLIFSDPGELMRRLIKEQIARSLNVPGRWDLAIVSVNRELVEPPIYLRTPFRQTPEDAATSVNYSIADLIRQGDLVPPNPVAVA